MVTTRPPKTIVKPTALGSVANTDTKLLIYGLFQKGRVLAQDALQGTVFPVKRASVQAPGGEERCGTHTLWHDVRSVEIRVRDTWRQEEAAEQPLLRPHRGTVGLRKVAPGKLEAGHTVIAGDSTTTCSPAGTDVSFMVSSATKSSPRSLT